MSDEEQNDKIEFDRMPGSDAPEEPAAESLDLNFGLGEEPAEEPDDVEEVVAEAEEAPVEAVEEAEEPVAEDEAPAVEAEAVEEEPESEEPAQNKNHMIPKHRYDSVRAENKALEKQVEALLAQQKEPDEYVSDFDIAAKETEMYELMLDGENQKAAALRQQIEAERTARLEHHLTEKITRQVNESQQATALQRAAAQIEEQFPIFDSKSDQYNEPLTNEVNALHVGLQQQGMNTVEALDKAVKYVLMGNNLLDMTPNGPEPSALGQKSATKVDEVAKKRAEVSRKLKAAESQPPEMPGESSSARGEKALDIASMTEDEFNALPEATLKRLRGDIM